MLTGGGLGGGSTAAHANAAAALSSMAGMAGVTAPAAEPGGLSFGAVPLCLYDLLRRFGGALSRRPTMLSEYENSAVVSWPSLQGHQKWRGTTVAAPYVGTPPHFAETPQERGSGLVPS